MKIHRGNFESNILFLEKAKVLKKKYKILEIGSGNGAMVSYLKKKGFDVTGTEINKKYISFAKKHFGVKLLSSKGESLPFKDKSFDVVLSFDVFEHIPDSNQHLQEVKRVLKNGGVYAFATPNKYTNIPYEILRNKNLISWRKYHCSLQSFWSLKKLLTVSNFTISFQDVPIFNSFFKHKFQKTFGNTSLRILSWLNIDKLPLFLRTNFYVIARKTKV